VLFSLSIGSGGGLEESGAIAVAEAICSDLLPVRGESAFATTAAADVAFAVFATFLDPVFVVVRLGLYGVGFGSTGGFAAVL